MALATSWGAISACWSAGVLMLEEAPRRRESGREKEGKRAPGGDLVKNEEEREAERR